MHEWSSSLIPSLSRPDVLEIEALRIDIHNFNMEGIDT